MTSSMTASTDASANSRMADSAPNSATAEITQATMRSANSSSVARLNALVSGKPGQHSEASDGHDQY
jgi:hypothetical protein